MRQRTRLEAALLAMALGGCIVSPQPEPPNVRVETLRFTQTELVGGEGAVRSAMGVLWLVDIKGTGPAIEVPVQPDGSFGPIDWTTRAPAGEVVAQNRIGGRPWSDPVVFERDPPTDGARAPGYPFLSCFALAPQLDFGTVAAAGEQILDLAFENQCGEAIDFGMGTLFRLVSPAFDLPDGPFVRRTLNAGEGGTLRIRLTGVSPGPHEDILVLDVRPAGMMGNVPVRVVVLVGDSL